MTDSQTSVHFRLTKLDAMQAYTLKREIEGAYFSKREEFVDEKYGSNYLKKKKIKKELAQTNKELKRLKNQVASLEQRKAELQDSLEEGICLTDSKSQKVDIYI